jgi:hypothetical protein
MLADPLEPASSLATSVHRLPLHVEIVTSKEPTLSEYAVSATFKTICDCPVTSTTPVEPMNCPQALATDVHGAFGCTAKRAMVGCPYVK